MIFPNAYELRKKSDHRDRRPLGLKPMVDSADFTRRESAAHGTTGIQEFFRNLL